MKKLIIKIDQFMLDQLTNYIKIWIKKHDYKKHKIDFMIQMDRIEIYIVIVWAMTIPVLLYVVEGKYFNAGVHGILWISLIGFRVILERKIHMDIKSWYDRIFSMRKNPIIYNMHKEILEEMFIEKRRNRLVWIAFSAIFLGLISAFLFSLHFVSPGNSFVAEYFLLSIGFIIMNRYILYVFDFDPPKPKEKKKRASITEIMMREWQQLIEGLSTRPKYG